MFTCKVLIQWEIRKVLKPLSLYAFQSALEELVRVVFLSVPLFCSISVIGNSNGIRYVISLIYPLVYELQWVV